MITTTAFMCTNGGCGLLVFTYFVVFPLLAIVILAAIVYALSWLVRERTPQDRPSLKREAAYFAKILGTLMAVAMILALVFVAIPTMLKDDRYLRLQESCAKQVGYSSPADDNNLETATAESQVAYRECLSR